MSDKTPPGPDPRIPKPAHPRERREPLPWRHPKPAVDDPRAPARLEAIMRHPAYRVADEDTAFLRRDELRGVRLQLDFQKAETLLAQAGVARSIVVFGSTRIAEPAAARRRVEALREEARADPENAEMARRLAVAERILAKSKYYEVARAFGRLAGEDHVRCSADCAVIVTGGGPGVMEAANRGAHDAGAINVGLNITLPHEQFPNPYVTEGLCFSFHYFSIRKMHLLKRAVALVVFPGGYGTMDEMFEVLTLIQTRKIDPIPVVLVGENFWRRAIDFDFLVEEGVIDAEDHELFWFAETAEDIWRGIARWREADAARREARE